MLGGGPAWVRWGWGWRGRRSIRILPWALPSVRPSSDPIHCPFCPLGHCNSVGSTGPCAALRHGLSCAMGFQNAMGCSEQRADLCYGLLWCHGLCWCPAPSQPLMPQPAAAFPPSPSLPLMLLSAASSGTSCRRKLNQTILLLCWLWVCSTPALTAGKDTALRLQPSVRPWQRCPGS